MSGGGEAQTTLEHTPTWVVALVCTVIVAVSLAPERFLHYVGKILKKKRQKPLYEALQKVKEELTLLGFISLLLTVTQNGITKICVPPGWTRHMLPCKLEEGEGGEWKTPASHFQSSFSFPDISGTARRLLAEASASKTDYCARKHKVPLLSVEAMHHLQIFIFVLAIAHVTFCVLTVFFGGLKIRQWKHWEDSITEQNYEANEILEPKITHVQQHAFIKGRFLGFGKDSTLMGWLHSFFKQFYGSVNKLDYSTLRHGFIMTHNRSSRNFNFHKYMIRALEGDFKQVVGISWYLWIFVVIFLLLNINGWHTYFWIAFIPFLLLLAVGTKLEHVIIQLAHEVAERHVVIEGGGLFARRLDDHFWFHRPHFVLFLIHFILFQNSFEIAFFFWIWVTYGFGSCIMGQVCYIVPRLVIGVFIQVLCSYSTLPVYALVTQMGADFKMAIFSEHVRLGLVSWAQRAKKKKNTKKKEHRDHIYDVFLSFRGEDTRASFTSHLYASLSNAGIFVFKDDAELPKGNHISIELLRRIESSKILIIIFSRDYAGSRWCLEELSKIMEVHKSFGKIVLPVFYGVDPSEIRHQTSSFGEAFNDLLRRISPPEDQVFKWRTALREAGGIAGFVVLGSRNESEDIKNIVGHVCNIIDKKDLFVANHPVGVNSRVQDVIQILESYHSKDVNLVGIWGMGGIGKTTIAKAIYNEIGSAIFESRSFLSNIREVWEQDNGPIFLQNQLLYGICKTTNMKINSVESGKIILRDRLCHQKALVVLDDVDKLDQINALVGSCEWFGAGSKIIITTRNIHLLNVLQVDCVYRMKNLEKWESVELFSWHAFKQTSPKEGFIELSENVVAYSGGLPLALEVLGSYLFDKEVIEWMSVLKKLKEIPNDEIQKKLRISFDGLSDNIEKEIFLDISCFFIGMDRNDVTQILNGCGFFADIGISVLVERSLVTIGENNKLGMHDLLRDMGREIIREQSAKEPEERSRLWFHQDVVDVLLNYTGTKTVEGLALRLSQIEKVCFCTKAFKRMKRLRLLCLGNVQLEGDYQYISRYLRWLCWHSFPLEYIPVNFYQQHLVAIDLKYSSLRHVWKEPQLLESLKILNLSHSHYLVQTPDFSKLPNLEKLILKDCPSLSMIHHTIGLLDRLLLLNFKDCSGLRSLPRSIYKLKCLKTLILSGCSMVEKLEEDIEQMDSLTTLIADDTAITQVPFSLVRLKSIGYISLCGYEGLSRDVFPSLIQSWMSPTNNHLPLIPTYAGMPSSILWDILNRSVPSGSSSIPSNPPKPQSVLMECGLEIESQFSGGVTKMLDSLYATNCMDISRLENYLRHLLIQIGQTNQVTSTLSESIAQGLTLTKYGDDCVLPGDKYPYWLTFLSEGDSVKFEVPSVNGGDLKGMTLCCVYFILGVSTNNAFDSLISLMIINYTKTTTMCYKRDKVISFKEVEWKEIISNLNSNDQVEVVAIFGNGFTVKKMAVYLIYDDSFDEQIECSSSSASNLTGVKYKGMQM